MLKENNIRMVEAKVLGRLLTSEASPSSEGHGEAKMLLASIRDASDILIDGVGDEKQSSVFANGLIELIEKRNGKMIITSVFSVNDLTAKYGSRDGSKLSSLLSEFKRVDFTCDGKDYRRYKNV